MSGMGRDGTDPTELKKLRGLTGCCKRSRERRSTGDDTPGTERDGIDHMELRRPRGLRGCWKPSSARLTDEDRW